MKLPLAPLIIVTFLVFGFLPRGSAEWFAGSARVKITPEKPVVMAGYAGRTEPFKTIVHDLWAKALVLEDSTGARFAIITTDLSGIYADLTPEIYSGIAKQTGIQQENILLTWSHTHSGPSLRTANKRYPAVDEANLQNTIDYTNSLTEKLIRVVDLAARSLQVAELHWGQGFVPFVMNRRQRTADGIRLNPNPSGHVDRSLPCLEVKGKDGYLIASLFQVACHNTTLTAKNYALCGDFAGFAQLHIEEAYPGSNAMFMTGCAGNANPYPRGTLEIAADHGRAVGQEVCRLLSQELSPVRGPLSTKRADARLSLQAPRPIDELESIADSGPNWLTGNARRMAEVLKAGESLPKHFEAPISVWQFADDLTLVGLSGEVVSGYALAIQNAVGHRNLWIASYCHDYYGYLPTAQIVRDGGYETRGLSNGLGWFDEKAEDEMVQAVVKLAKRAGRQIDPGR